LFKVIVAFPLRGIAENGVVLLFSFVLKQKFKALTSYATKQQLQLKDLNSLSLKQQIFLNASTAVLLNATKFKALDSLGFYH